MTSMRAWLVWCLLAVSGVAIAAPEIGTVSIVEGGGRVLRGVNWYKLVPGARVEDGDIIDAGERGQINVEMRTGNVINLVGPGQLYLVPPAGKPEAVLAPAAFLRSGWLKVLARPPGVQIRSAAADIAVADGVLVLRLVPPAFDLFVEAGAARVGERLPSGAAAPVRDANRGEFWTKTGATPFAVMPRVSKPFIDAMPRHFTDALPSLAGKYGSRPALTVERELTFAEAEPWLATGDRAAFERRFGSRLRDPVFRRSAALNSSRYPMWDRILHPEKYLPKPMPTK